MVIGIDLSVLQTPHRLRGIGSTAINFIKNLPDQEKQDSNFVFYVYESSYQEVLDLLDIKNLNVRYEIKFIKEDKRFSFKLPGRLHLLNGFINSTLSFRDLIYGDSRIKDLSTIDVFLQFDQMRPTPRSSGATTGLVIYDLIPYIMETDYLWSYGTARANGDSRKAALKKAYHRRMYAIKARATAKRADKLIAISEHTKQDYIKYLGIKPGKIEVAHLGVDSATKKTPSKVSFDRFVETSWGYMPRPVNLDEKPFLLFVGGADSRRKIQDLVTAYNHLKAEGNDIRLVLAGDTMKGPLTIPTLAIQKALLTSSYLDDIVFLGFVTDEQRNWLYQKARAFVYPTLYEGFGLPVLEAMSKGSPVITYSNSSINEIAGEAALFANTSEDILEKAAQLLSNDTFRNEYIKKGSLQAHSFSWESTVLNILNILKRS